MRVLLVGHACCPCSGSEPAFTWNWAWHLSFHHEVWVLTHPCFRDAVDRYLAENPNPNLHFFWVALPLWCDPWSPKRGKRGIRVHYLLWQRAAFRLAALLRRKFGFDLVHHVSWGTMNAPPLLWRLPVPFVWGPVGGGQVTPPRFSRYFGRGWLLEIVRRAAVGLAPRRPAIRSAARASRLVFATNLETARVLRAAGARNVQLLLDSGLTRAFVAGPLPSRKPHKRFTLLWVGQLERRKALPLALEALAQIKHLDIQLLVAGDGQRRKEWEGYARLLGIAEKVRFLGRVPYEKMPELYCRADLFVFTSLRDSFGSQVLEAMGAGLPVVTLDIQGARAFVPHEAAVKVPATSPPETVSALACAIDRLLQSDDDRERMAIAAREFAKTQTWDRKAEAMGRWYDQVVGEDGCGTSQSPLAYPKAAGAEDGEACIN